MVLKRTKRQENNVVKIQKPKDNFGISKHEFDKYLKNLKNGDDSLITKIMVHHLPSCMTYLQKRFKVSHEKSYDICMDTFLEFRQKLINNKIKYGNLRFLYTRMSVNRFIDEKKNEQKLSQAISQFMLESNAESIYPAQFFDHLNDSILKLKPEQQDLLKEIYSGRSLKDLAEELSIKYSLIRKQKERLVKKLRIIFFESLDKTKK